MWNCFKVEPKRIFLFFWIWTILNFNQTWLKDKLLDFLQNILWIWDRYQTEFFQWMGGQARCACASLTGPAPSFLENSVWKRSQIQSMFCKKSRNLSWVRSGWSSKWLIFKKSRKFCFGSTLKQFHMWYAQTIFYT